MELLYDILLVSSLLAIASIATSLISFRFGAPLLLLFLAVGLLAGPGGLGITFSDPQTAFVIASIALAAILFESGYNTPVQSYRLAVWPALTLATAGVLLTAGITMLAGVYLLKLTWMEAALLGAVLSSTDAAAIFFLMRTGGINIRDRVRSTLEIESGCNDPMAIMLTIVLVQIAGLVTAVSGEHSLTMLEIFGHLVTEIAVGVALGWAGGKLLVYVINKMDFQAELYPLISLVIAFFIFALAGKLGGSGFLAIYITGLIAGNSRIKSSFFVRKFHEGISWLGQLTMFLVLGLMADMSHLAELAVPAFVLTVVLTLLARPFATYICLFPFQFTPAEFGFVAWAGLRGAVSILLALLPLMAKLPGSDVIFTVAFLCVIYSLLIQGWTIGPVARALNLIVPAQTGPVNRMEFDLTPARTVELVAYKVHPDSPINNGAALPPWMTPALILRENKQYYTIENAGGIKRDDQVYFFTDPKRLAVFDRLFGAPMDDAEMEREFFGDIILNPNVTVRDLAKEYDVRTTELPDLNQTLADIFQKKYWRGFEIGDRIRIGRVELIIREMEDGVIKSIGLAFIAPRLRDQIMHPMRPVQRFVAGVRSIMRSSVNIGDDTKE